MKKREWIREDDEQLQVLPNRLEPHNILSRLGRGQHLQFHDIRMHNKQFGVVTFMWKRPAVLVHTRSMSVTVVR